MASQIKVNEIIKQSGSSISIGESGDALTFTGNLLLEQQFLLDQWYWIDYWS